MWHPYGTYIFNCVLLRGGRGKRDWRGKEREREGEGRRGGSEGRGKVGRGEAKPFAKYFGPEQPLKPSICMYTSVTIKRYDLTLCAEGGLQ